MMKKSFGKIIQQLSEWDGMKEESDQEGTMEARFKFIRS